ncbi:fish-egg lectin-like isoform X2 [Hyperolius riggenbachi]|uniref:fish-egg lectin-like isoform X2 n=1 Tax=Hyperolius riggenbachi TaxID=752182 RepID=UPI0035A349FB
MGRLAAHYECTLIPGKLKQIDAGAGEVYGVNSNDKIYRWVKNDWQLIPGNLKHVTVGPAGVWGVNSADQIFRFQNNKWMQVKGSMKQVDAGGPKFLAGVNANDNIYCLKRSCTMSGVSDVSYAKLDGSIKYYTCGSLGCWGVNAYNMIYYRNNVTPTFCQGHGWQEIKGGNLAMLEVGSDNAVYGVTPAGSVLRRDGITAANPVGTTWTELDLCGTYKDVTFDNSYLWLLNNDGDIFRCSQFK